MKKLLTAFAAIIVLASCQKEADFDANNPNGNNGGSGSNGNTSGLLVKTVAVTGSETQTTFYTYDSQQRLETMSIKGMAGGMIADSYHKYVRDGAGRIVKVLQKIADPMPGVTADTGVITYHYPDATTMNFDYRVMVTTLNMGGMAMSTIDSSVYSYTSGKLMSYRSFMSSSLMPGAVMSEGRTDFSYDASEKVIGMKMFDNGGTPGAPLDLVADYKYTYAATSTNNVYISASGAQNFALNGLPNTTPSVITKTEVSSNATTPPMTVVISTSYVNGAGNKPATGTSVVTTTGQPTQTTKYTFFYQ